VKREREDKIQFSVTILEIVMNKNMLTNIQQQRCENLSFLVTTWVSKTQCDS